MTQHLISIDNFWKRYINKNLGFHSKPRLVLPHQDILRKGRGIYSHNILAR